MTNYLDQLSDSQRAAAQNTSGASLIVAGAGSGKTRTLTYRIAHLIDSGVAPYNILALTFTNKAAREMRERIESILPPSALRGLWMGTFHSVFRRILAVEGHRLGYPQNFTIYETADSRNLVKSIVRELELPEERYKPSDIFGRISLAKNSLITPASYAANEGARAEDEEARRGELYRVYARYVERCKNNGAMDFDDMLLQMNVLLRDHAEVAAQYGELFHYIMVDEYQDTNFSQYLIVKKLAAAHGNICVVGDDSQSIYSFRGARIENILRFEKDFPDAKTYKLEQNYRSTRTIVEASNSLIDHNTQKLPKTLFSEAERGDLIRVVEAYTDKDEATRVADDIFRTIYREGAEPSDFAILYRTNKQSLAFEEQLRQRNIPYKIYGGKSFFQRAEIKDMLCYLRLAINPADDEALKRIINTPSRGIGQTSIERVEAAAIAQNSSMFDILRTMDAAQIGIRGTAVRGIANFVNSFAEIAQKTESLDAYEFASAVADKSGLVTFYKMSNAVEDKTRLENIEELLNSIKSFTMPEQMGEEAEPIRTFTIGEWLSEAALLTDLDNDKQDDTPKVTLLTAHSSKGLEFNNIYVVGMEERAFPSVRLTSSESDIEEERRLFYVALTRARRRATLCYALSRFKWGEVVAGTPSRFIAEIDPRHLDMQLTGDGQSRVERTLFNRQLSPTPTRRPMSGGGNRVEKPRPIAVEKPLSTPTHLRKVDSTPAPAGKQIESIGDIKIGSRVNHDRFGDGEITAIEKTVVDLKITVIFDKAGEKTLLQKFARLSLLDN